MAESEFDHLREAPGFTWTREWEGPRDRYLLGLREGGFSLYTERTTAAHFDLEGRLRRAFLEDSAGWSHYLRGFDGRLLRKRKVLRGDPVPPGESEASLELADRRGVYERTHVLVQEALESLPDSRDEEKEADSPGALLSRAAAYHPDRLEEECRRFLQAYRPIGILPPDRYLSLILQATEGCAYNGCIFCSLYRGQRFRAKGPDEFRDHVKRVKAFLGRALSTRKGVFLGEANALTIPQPALKSLLQVLHRELPVELLGDPHSGSESARAPSGPGGISSFLDAFTTRDKGPREMAELRDLGLRRVFLGIESGHQEVLSFLKKPASNEGVRELVGAFKESGVSLGAIFLIGAGGKQYERRHLEASVELARSLPLDGGDLIYLSPLVVEPGGRYETGARARGITPLTAAEMARQDAELRKILRPAPGENRPKVTRYDIESFIY